MFQEDQNESFPAREERILEFWEKLSIFHKSLENRKNGPLFSFYDGPPFATGLPHYGHILAGTLKDVIPRYKTMQGYYVPRRFGWDCHGLPVENEIEKAKELSGAASIETFGIAQFNEECRSIVLRYVKEWEGTVKRMGRWVDFDHTYKTMDKSFMESVWWVFGQLFGKGFVYEGFKVMPFSAKLGTPLSNFEANLNYKDVDDPSLVVAFPIESDPNTALLAWTTTPWTLPSNLALMVSPDLEYVKVKDKSGKFYILAKARLSQYFKEDFEVVESFLGSHLKGRKYLPLFSYFAKAFAFRVILEESVSAEEGTGIVHAAPAFGELDYFACSKEGIEPVCPVNQNGQFTKEVPEYEGLFVKDADKDIIKRLKAEGRVFHQATIRHRYPFCWRSDTPLIYKVVHTWFVAVEKIKDRLLAANEQIHWVPDHIKNGRFGKWLENARDWAVSRNRYWGTPIPIWRSETGNVIAISSIEELEKRTGKKITDLHRHFIDDLTFEENGETYKRIPQVFDCWFESGSMPYAQNHFPFENKEETLNSFPGDFIAEGLDQTRGWFYTLTVLAVALFDKPAFKNVIVNGIILAEDGQKMSKRLKNYPEPTTIFNQYGADAVRLYLLNSPVVQAEDFRFSEKGVEQVLRQVLIPLWNSFHFLSTYARIYKWSPAPVQPKEDIDRWILSRLQKLTGDVRAGLDSYELIKAVDPFVGFIEQLTNWYIRRCRSRFWSGDTDALATLYHVLFTLCKITAPFIPFISEAIYLKLKTGKDPESVHLCDFPQVDENLRGLELENEMSYVQAVVSGGHALRKEHKVKVRQPLRTAHIVTSNIEMLKALEKQKHLIADELNVKEVVYHSDETSFVTLSPKPNFRILGKKVGKLMNEVGKAIQELPQKDLKHLMQGGSVKIQDFELLPEDVEVVRKVKEGIAATTIEAVTIALELALDEELLLEGLARELVNKINTMRRDDGFAVTDRIAIQIKTTDRLKQAFNKHRDYIMGEVLGTDIAFTDCEGTAWDLNGEQAVIAITQMSII